MKRSVLFSTASALVLTLAACEEPMPSNHAVQPTADSDLTTAPGTHTQYGTPQQLGNGHVRTYIVLDQKANGTPLEVGVAISEDAMDGLPESLSLSGDHEKGGHHANMFVYLLDMPAHHQTVYEFVQFDWNPAGHEPDSIYTIPHFDFHFYTVPASVRNSIVPADPAFAQKAAALPGAEFRPPYFLDAATLAGGIPAAAATVPQMGLHWLDVRSPELQKAAGNPDAWAPFTRTFIYGSWDGEFIFLEPMITRDYILAKRMATDPAVRDEIIPISMPARYARAGYYPDAYRITYDARAKEYRIALTQLAPRN